MDGEERNSLAALRRRIRWGGGLITSQTLETVLEEQEAVFHVHIIGGGRRVTELGVGFVALRRADPGEPDFGGVADDDVVAGSHVQRSQAVDEELCEAAKRKPAMRFTQSRSALPRSPSPLTQVSHPCQSRVEADLLDFVCAGQEEVDDAVGHNAVGESLDGVVEAPPHV